MRVAEVSNSKVFFLGNFQVRFTVRISNFLAIWPRIALWVRRGVPEIWGAVYGAATSYTVEGGSPEPATSRSGTVGTIGVFGPGGA